MKQFRISILTLFAVLCHHLTLRLVYTDKEDTGIQRPIQNMEGKAYRLNGVLLEKPVENEIYIFNGKKIIKQ